MHQSSSSWTILATVNDHLVFFVYPSYFYITVIRDQSLLWLVKCVILEQFCRRMHSVLNNCMINGKGVLFLLYRFHFSLCCIALKQFSSHIPIWIHLTCSCGLDKEVNESVGGSNSWCKYQQFISFYKYTKLSMTINIIMFKIEGWEDVLYASVLLCLSLMVWA